VGGWGLFGTRKPHITSARPRAHTHPHRGTGPAARCPPDRPPLQLLLAPRPYAPATQRPGQPPIRRGSGLGPARPTTRSGAHVSGVWSHDSPPAPHAFPTTERTCPRPAPPAGRKQQGSDRRARPRMSLARQQGKAPGRKTSAAFPCLRFFFHSPSSVAVEIARQADSEGEKYR
jgi:hypothetical protein